MAKPCSKLAPELTLVEYLLFGMESSACLSFSSVCKLTEPRLIALNKHACKSA